MAAIGATIGYGNVVDGDGDVDANVCNAAHDEDGDDDSKVRDYDYSCDCSVVYEESGNDDYNDGDLEDDGDDHDDTW